MSVIAEHPDGWLILSEPGDPTAEWLKVGLAQRGLSSCLVTTCDLIKGANWVHSVSADGGRTSFRIEGGQLFSSDGFRHALSLISYLPPRPVETFVAQDREYASQEWIAFIVSALAAVPNWVNPIGPGGIGGRYHSGFEWILLAHEVGLLCDGDDNLRPAPANPVTREVLVFRGHVFSYGVPTIIAHRVCELFSLAEIQLGGARFRVNGRRWRFVDATGTPECMAGGSAFLDALAELR